MPLYLFVRHTPTLSKALRRPLVRRRTMVHGTQGQLFFRDQWVDPANLADESDKKPSSTQNASATPAPATPAKQTPVKTAPLSLFDFAPAATANPNTDSSDAVANEADTYHYEEQSGKKKRVRGKRADEPANAAMGGLFDDDVVERLNTRIEEIKRRLTNVPGKESDEVSSDAVRATVHADLGGNQPEAGGGVDGGRNHGEASLRSSGTDQGQSGGLGGTGLPAERSGGSGSSDVLAAVDGLSETAAEAIAEPVAEEPLPARPAYAGRALRPDLSDNPDDLRLSEADGIGKGSLREKLAANLAAIDLLKELESSERTPTDEEKRVLAHYVGWGAFGQAFQSKFAHHNHAPGEQPSYLNSYWKPVDFEHYAINYEIKQRLTPEEFQAAQHSILNAHYTAPAVVESMWGALKHLGFQSGRVLEPAMGTGNFFGFQPEDTLQNTARTGVELDSLTGRISQLLYPDARVHITGFQDAPLADNYFDVAVSNVPFGKYGVHDENFNATGRNAQTKSIHNYFFAKALDKVRPGGVVAFVTSRYTLDARTQAHVREYLGEQAHFLGAVRLPSDAFKENAGTDVTTDVIFLQKKDPAFEALHPRDALGHFINKWKDSVKQGEGEETYDLNEYFVQHPEMMLGTVKLGHGMYGNNEFSLASDGRDIKDAMQAALATLPANVMHAATNAQETAALDQLREAASYMKPGSFHVVDGAVMFNTPNGLEKIEGDEKTLARMTALCALRDKAQEIVSEQLNQHATDRGLEVLRIELSAHYDSFTAKYGLLHARANYRAFCDDPDSGLLLSLEDYDDEAKTATKADIFSRRTMRPDARADNAENASEALAISLNETGGIDWERISSLLGREPEDVRDELARDGRIFKDPTVADTDISGGYVTSEEYLSGNVRRKLEEARAAVKVDPSLQSNVEALELVQPELLGPGDISVNLGAHWIPAKVLNAFLESTIGGSHLDSGKNLVFYNDLRREWKVKPMSGSDSRRDNAKNTEVYGTPSVPFTRLLQHALLQTQPNVYKDDPNDSSKRIFDKEKSLAARQKLQEVRNAWQNFLEMRPDIASELAGIYNEKYNNTRLRQYDGSHLTFPGLSPIADGGDVRQHIRDAVWRTLQTGTGLYDHVVGSGKTKAVIITAMEQRRLGLAKKPMITVPNNNLPQWEAAFREYYPGAKVLTVWSKDWTPAKRKEITAKIATGDWDAILITHSAFEKIPVSEEAYRDYYSEERANLLDAIAREEEENGKSKTGKQMETALSNLEVKMEEKIARAKKNSDNCLCFEQLGVDALHVDEADLYKNLYFVTRQRGVAGLAGSESGRAQDMFIKSQWMLRKNNNRGLVFATGTPISNSLAEMWTMRRYLDMPKLKEEGLNSFDAWSASFGEIKNALEKTASGKYKVKSRFAKFVNAPEMIKAYRRFADVRTREDLKHILPTPELSGGAPIVNISPMSDAQHEYMALLQERSKAIEDGDVAPEDDNHLKLSSDARKMSLDMRLIDPTAPDAPDSKLNQCVANIEKIYQDGHEHKGTQLLFVDLGTPKEVTAKEEDGGAEEVDDDEDGEEGEVAASRMNHSIYEDVKRKLVARGIPAHEIAFATDFKTDVQRKMRDRKVNSGEIRVLIGSTAKMGAGLNVQERLLALHHLDCPWRPRDVEQREGRILRQGNMFRDLNIPVQIHRYGTEGSFDEIMWNTISRKAGFIAQARSGNLQARSMEEVDPMKLTSAQMAAVVSGNPMILERANIDVEMETLASLRRSHLNAQDRIQQETSSLPSKIRDGSEYAKHLEAAAQLWEQHKPGTTEDFRITIQGATHSGRDTATQAFNNASSSSASMARNERAPVRVGSIGPFQIEVHPPSQMEDLLNRKTPVAICAPDGRTRVWAKADLSDGNIVQSIESAMRGFGRRGAEERGRVAEAQRNLDQLREHMGKPFAQQERMTELEKRAREIDEFLAKGDGAEAADTDAPEDSAIKKALGSLLKTMFGGVVEKALQLQKSKVQKSLGDAAGPTLPPRTPVAAVVQRTGAGQYHYDNVGGHRHRAPGARVKPAPVAAGGKPPIAPSQGAGRANVAGGNPPQKTQATATPTTRYATPQEAHRATGEKANDYFTHQENSLPSDKHARNPVRTEEEAYEHAGRHKEHLDTLLNRGKGLDHHLGLHVVNGLPKEEDYETARRKGGMVILAPLKGATRLREKVDAKYGGDFGRARDISRATVAVNHPDDLAHVTHTLRKLGMKFGNSPEDRFARPTPAGYSDVQMSPIDAHGYSGELQGTTLDMLQAKELGLDGGHSGHHLYERLSEIEESNRELSPEERDEREEIVKKSQQLYSTAKARQTSRPGLSPRPLFPANAKASDGNKSESSTGESDKLNKAMSTPGSETENADMLAPGYFSYDGSLARMQVRAGRPQVWSGTKWEWVKDIGSFDHSATRLSSEEAEKTAHELGIKGSF